ncbi:hypothetical protein PP730_23290, partial [Ralstonia solanacearum]|nr:hypothetical protein [Ralstonia solanacearum]
IEQVNQAVNQMDEVTQQNAALVEEAAAAAQSLEEQARLLRETVASFRLPQGGEARVVAAPAARSVVKPTGAASAAKPVVRKPAVAVRARAPRKPAAEAPVAKAPAAKAPAAKAAPVVAAVAAEPSGGKLALSAAAAGADQDDWAQF